MKDFKQIEVFTVGGSKASETKASHKMWLQMPKVIRINTVKG